MAQVVARCRLTGHYMFMGLDVEPKTFTSSGGPFARKFCPFCSCEHSWYKEDCKFLPATAASGSRIQQAS